MACLPDLTPGSYTSRETHPGEEFKTLSELVQNDAQWLQQGPSECARAVAAQHPQGEVRSERSKEAAKMVVYEEADFARRMTGQGELG